jgi:putative molybdopterin biosynthesis protein
MTRRYLSLISFDEALNIMRESFPPPGVTERISLEQSVGRVTAEPVFASYPVPGADLSAMDGIAVRSRDTLGARDRLPKVLEDYDFINTGQPLPAGFDAVIMIEDVWMSGAECRIRKSAFPGQFIHPAGEDIRRGDLILPKGHVVRAGDTGGLATYGITSLVVLSASIGFIPTGNELIPAGARPGPGHVVESNSTFARNFFAGMGAACRRYPIVSDDPEMLADLLCHAVGENELVILSAGSSSGTTDFTEQVISSCGSVLFHGVAMKPGTPVMLGSVEGKPVLGVPGYPVATACTIREFAGRLLAWWGFPPFPSYPVKARLSQSLSSDLGYEEFVPVSVGKVGEQYCAVPLARGNGVQMSVIRSNGYLTIPASHEGIREGEDVLVHLTDQPSTLDRILLAVGVRDACIHLLGSSMADYGCRMHMCASRDLNALRALQGGYCHAATVSLPGIGSWLNNNLFWSLDGGNFLRVTVADAELGLASQEGLSLADVPHVRFLTRPPGSSARALAEELLLRRGIAPEQLAGYSDQARTDDGITAAILNGSADAGICRREPAVRAGLTWEPVGFESFEMVFHLNAAESPPLAGAFDALRSSAYRESVNSLPGYSAKRSGQVTACIPGSSGQGRPG